MSQTKKVKRLYIGNRLKQLRNEYGILQKDLAEQLNLSQQTISLYESNKRQPDYDTLRTIAEFFNVSTDYILGITNIKEPMNIISDVSDEYELNEKFKTYYSSKERIKALEILDKIYELSPESQEDVIKYIEMYKLWDEKQNLEGSEGLDGEE